MNGRQPVSASRSHSRCHIRLAEAKPMKESLSVNSVIVYSMGYPNLLFLNTDRMVRHLVKAGIANGSSRRRDQRDGASALKCLFSPKCHATQHGLQHMAIETTAIGCILSLLWRPGMRSLKIRSHSVALLHFLGHDHENWGPKWLW